jgi:hypothetical protein
VGNSARVLSALPLLSAASVISCAQLFLGQLPSAREARRGKSHAAAGRFSARRRARRGRGADCNRGRAGDDRFRVTVTNAGTYRAQSLSAPSGADQLSPTSKVGTASNWHFVSKTTDVTGEVGTQLGIEFRLEGNPVGDGVTLHMVLKFPAQGIRNPNTGDTMHNANIAFANLKIGALSRLLHELRQSLDQQAAASDVLQVISASICNHP